MRKRLAPIAVGVLAVAGVGIGAGHVDALSNCQAYQSGGYAVSVCYSGSGTQRVVAGTPTGTIYGPCVGLGQRSAKYIPWNNTAYWIIAQGC